MDSLMKADIFFFISTVFLIVFAIIGLIGAFYVVKILRDVRHIADKVKNESENIIADVSRLRSGIKANAARAANIQSAAAVFKTAKNVWDGMKSKNEEEVVIDAEVYDDDFDEEDIDAEIEELLARKKHRRRRKK